MKHYIRSFIGIMFLIIGHLVIGNEILTPKFINVESALIHIKMDIAFLKIRRTGFPNLRFRVEFFNFKPSTVAA